MGKKEFSFENLFWGALGLFAAFQIVSKLIENPAAFSAPLSPHADTVKAVKLTDWDWQETRLGMVSVDAHIVNLSKHNVKDIVITCAQFGKSGTKIKAVNETLFQVLNAGEAVDVKEWNMGFMDNQTDSVSCKVTGLTLI